MSKKQPGLGTPSSSFTSKYLHRPGVDVPGATEEHISSFKKNHYCIIKNYVPEAFINNLLMCAKTSHLYHPQNGRLEAYNATRFAYPTSNPLLDTTIKNISKTRLQVVKADTNPISDSMFTQTITEQKYWCRFMKYSKGHPFPPHRDSRHEVMAIMFLSQPGQDYSGGLTIIKDDLTEINLDSFCNKGDLLIVSGGRYIHYVDTAPTPGRDGRITFFVNSHPSDLEGVLRNFSNVEEARNYIRATAFGNDWVLDDSKL
tara:strand:+ start:10235 stop:11008 length:774 start_codon:yes stop_codon:yes gene_type:complete